MAAVIARSCAKLERGMPVDMDHALEFRNTRPAPAVGWVKELAARKDGSWGLIAWTPTGKAMVEGREYRFISPAIKVSRAGEVLEIINAALTNNPAINMQAMCSAEGDEAGEDAMGDAEIVAILREAMGTPADMSVPDLIKRART
ncbi:MAG: phage protease, partial [Paracoccus sp. (in: a-proteobacteria)]